MITDKRKKLSDEDKRDIIISKLSPAKLAALYNVQVCTIYKVINNRKIN
jgi:hypothetical protein